MPRQSLRQVPTEYPQHNNDARPHRSPGWLTPAQAGTCPPEPVNLAKHRARRKQVLGGLTHESAVAKNVAEATLRRSSGAMAEAAASSSGRVTCSARILD
jgi:hypothetical protein